MAEKEVIFHNKIKIRVQAQIFIGRTLISTCVADPGEVCVLSTEAAHYDIYFKNGATGRGIAYRLDNETLTHTLSQRNGRYIIT